MEEDIYTLIVRELSGESDEKEARQLKSWINKKNNRLIYHAIIQYMDKENSATNQAQKEVFNRIVNQINAETEGFVAQPNRMYSIPAWVKVAAILVLALGISWFTYRVDDSSRQPISQNVSVEKANPRGQKSSFVLDDGTLVKLNSESRLTFSKEFDQTKREVFLEGEAFFDVKKDSKRSFIVRTGELSTTALGTSFNVQAYTNENSVKVALVTGKVKVVYESENNKTQVELILNPSDMAHFNKHSQEMLKSTFDFDLELAWKNQTLYFKDAALSDMLKTLERWYGVSFNLKDSKNIQTSFTGKFKDKSLEYVLDVLSKNQENFSYTISEKEVTFFKPKLKTDDK